MSPFGFGILIVIVITEAAFLFFASIGVFMLSLVPVASILGIVFYMAFWNELTTGTLVDYLIELLANLIGVLDKLYIWAGI